VEVIRSARASILAVSLLIPPVSAFAENPEPEMSLEIRQSLGCLASGTAGTLVALGVGAENLVNMISGGIVLPINTGALAVGIFGVVFAGFCTVGESLTPSVLHIMEHSAPVAARAGNTAMAAAISGYDSMASVARAGWNALPEAPVPSLTTDADWLAPAGRRLGEGRVAVTEAGREGATALASTGRSAAAAVADAGWSAIGGLCLRSAVCRARVGGTAATEENPSGRSIDEGWHVVILEPPSAAAPR
jgi:hypothetical protein